MTPHVLIVDDDKDKCNALASELLRCGIENEQIDVAYDAAQARRILNTKSFDVMLLDVLLPARADDKPRSDVSIDLLRQIIEDQTSPAPVHIIGITADRETLSKCQPEFQSLTSQILLVDLTLDDWRTALKHLVSRIHSSNDARSAYDYDICFQTALRSPELEAVVNFLPVSWSGEEQLSKGILYRKGVLSANGKDIRIACAHSTQMGLVAATHLTEQIIRELRPKVLGMSGICGGIADDVEIGDVIVAEKSWDWQSGKWDSTGNLQSSSDQKDASAELVALSRSLDQELSKFHLEYKGAKPENIPNLHIGPIVSGSSVVADTSLHDIFKRQHRKLVAVDMECYGVYYSIAMSSHPPKVLCIKSVSDLANQRKSDDFQEYCSYLSARSLITVFERYLIGNN